MRVGLASSSNAWASTRRASVNSARAESRPRAPPTRIRAGSGRRPLGPPPRVAASDGPRRPADSRPRRPTVPTGPRPAPQSGAAAAPAPERTGRKGPPANSATGPGRASRHRRGGSGKRLGGAAIAPALGQQPQHPRQPSDDQRRRRPPADAAREAIRHASSTQSVRENDRGNKGPSFATDRPDFPAALRKTPLGPHPATPPGQTAVNSLPTAPSHSLPSLHPASAVLLGGRVVNDPDPHHVGHDDL